MTNLKIHGDIVLLCHDTELKRSVLAALNCISSQKECDVSHQKSKPESFFDVYPNQSFKVSENFTDVMVNDQIFHHDSYHLSLVRLKEKIDTNDKNFEHKKTIYNKTPVEAVCVSRYIGHLPDKEARISSPSTNPLLTQSKKAQASLSTTEKLKTRRQRSQSFSHGVDIKLNLQSMTSLLPTSTITYRNLSEIAILPDKSGIVEDVTISPRNVTTSEIDRQHSRREYNDDEIDGANDATSSTSSSSSTLSLSQSIGTILNEESIRGSFDTMSLNFIPTDFSNNTKLASRFEAYGIDEWLHITKLVNIHNFAFSDCREFSVPLERPTKRVAQESKEFIGLVTSINNSNKICEIITNIHSVSQQKTLNEYILSSMTGAVHNASTPRSTAADTSDSEDSHTDNEATSVASDITVILGETPRNTQSKTRRRLSPVLVSSLFEDSRPKNALCYIVVVDLESDDDKFLKEFSKTLELIHKMILIDSIPEEYADVLSQENEDNSKSERNVLNYLKKNLFDANKSFVTIIGHSSKEHLQRQLEMKLKNAGYYAKVPMKTNETETFRLTNTSSPSSDDSIDKKEVHNTTTTEGIGNKNAGSRRNNPHFSQSARRYTAEHKALTALKEAKRIFSSHFMFINIDCTKPIQVALAFQKVATVILRQHTTFKFANVKTNDPRTSSRSKSKHDRDSDLTTVLSYFFKRKFE
jgi:hypothetical protein